MDLKKSHLDCSCDIQPVDPMLVFHFSRSTQQANSTKKEADQKEFIVLREVRDKSLETRADLRTP